MIVLWLWLHGYVDMYSNRLQCTWAVVKRKVACRSPMAAWFLVFSWHCSAVEGLVEEKPRVEKDGCRNSVCHVVVVACGSSWCGSSNCGMEEYAVSETELVNVCCCDREQGLERGTEIWD